MPLLSFSENFDEAMHKEGTKLTMAFSDLSGVQAK